MATTTPKAGANGAAAAKPPSRTEKRDAAVRATLTPIEPGERPWSIRIAVLLALMVGVGT